MSKIKSIELEFSGHPITDEELSVNLENCLRYSDQELLNNIARTVVQSHFPQISNNPRSGKALPLWMFPSVCQRLIASLTAEFKTFMDNWLGILRQWIDVRRH
ncbi:hypothetical protein J3D48_006348 [Pseudomonas fluorescens]|uniref:hypothetical protein n=1 Tax=Pseudomonas fluorescens TaxID=294 RepID=UPI00209DD9C7|nr:hypothetical protein [Pseudomonas fluorescens]MCP1489938.1 hypothetical protein [Pseudomonas fluorescens]